MDQFVLLLLRILLRWAMGRPTHTPRPWYPFDEAQKGRIGATEDEPGVVGRNVVCSRPIQIKASYKNGMVIIAFLK